MFAVPDPTYGQRVGTAVVLAPYEVPERLAVVPSLPHTAKRASDRGAVAGLYGH
ncbi:hypothetical protein ABT167_35185 [Streptomyces sp. NPDC001792]|uniref:hypothetical protein n=1 Tax=Streptomyces sp. NPDC001792 TaxID=3154524 RepID=UPI0033283C21